MERGKVNADTPYGGQFRFVIPLLIVNLILGAMLWLGYSTDISWAGTVVDWVFPTMVALVAMSSLGFKGDIHNRRKRRLYIWSCMPSLIGGGIATLFLLLMLVPPFTLGLLFTVSEISNEEHIQRVWSPDRCLVADVYFRGVGPYSGGNVRAYVRVSYPWLPFIERDVYMRTFSYMERDETDYIFWQDNNTIFISGEPERDHTIEREIAIGWPKFEIPVIIRLPYIIVRYLIVDSDK